LKSKYMGKGPPWFSIGLLAMQPVTPP
jgi:hypothetical protein